MNRKLKITAKLAAAGMAMILLSGCWDRIELEDRAIILAMAVDRLAGDPDKESEEVIHPAGINAELPGGGGYRISVQIALPGRIPLGPGDGGGGGGKSEESVWIVSSVGNTIDDALMSLQQKLSSIIFLGHLGAIIVSEEVARQGLANLNDFLRRNPEVRRMAWMMISNGEAEALLKAKPPLERVPALYLIATLDNAVRQGKFPEDFVGIFWSDSSKHGKEGFLPYVKLKNDENMLIDGLAIFRGDKMVGKTKPYQIPVYLEIGHINPGGSRKLIPMDNTEFTLYSTQRSSEIKLRMRNGAPEFDVTMEAELNLEEKSNEAVSVSTNEELRKIQQAAQGKLTQLATNVVDLTKELHADIFGFGEYVRAYQPAYWNRHIRTKEKWQQMYPDVPIHLKVEIHLRRVGMKAK